MVEMPQARHRFAPQPFYRESSLSVRKFLGQSTPYFSKSRSDLPTTRRSIVRSRRVPGDDIQMTTLPCVSNFFTHCIRQRGAYHAAMATLIQSSIGSNPLAERKDAETFERGWALLAFREGIEAARRKQPIITNPYRPGSERALLWDSGWKEGYNLYYR